MDYVSLGRTGLKVSRLCLGMMTYGSPSWRDWVLPEAEGRRFFRRALEHGIKGAFVSQCLGGRAVESQ
jgi:aryl-alcohol dehydrogenase (NADP+)